MKKFLMVVMAVVASLLVSSVASAKVEINGQGIHKKDDGNFSCSLEQQGGSWGCWLGFSAADADTLSASCSDDQLSITGGPMEAIQNLGCRGLPRVQKKFWAPIAGPTTYTVSLMAGNTALKTESYTVVPSSEPPLTPSTGVTKQEFTPVKDKVEDLADARDDNYIITGGYMPVVNDPDSHCGGIYFGGSPWAIDKVRGEFGGSFHYCDMSIPSYNLNLIEDYDRLRMGFMQAHAALLVPMGTKYAQFVLRGGVGAGYTAVDKSSAGQLADGTTLINDTGSFWTPVVEGRAGFRFPIRPIVIDVGFTVFGHNQPKKHSIIDNGDDLEFVPRLGPDMNFGVVW